MFSGALIAEPTQAQNNFAAESAKTAENKAARSLRSLRSLRLNPVLFGRG
jgi:hypothetical protein